MKKLYWCPSCHKEIVIPPMLQQSNIKTEKKITIKCGNCPNGKIKYLPPQITIKNDETSN